MMGIIMLVRSFFAFGCMYFINRWLADHGALKFLGILGGVGGAICVLAVPVYVWGKRLRWWCARHRLLRRVV